jgi:hypothetical protein
MTGNKHFDKKFVAGAGYLLAGLAGAALVTYSGYLGGRMVYTHGIGVTPADGIEPERTPEMPHDGFGRAARASASNVGHALRHTAQEMAQGEIVRGFRTVRPLESRPLDKLSPVPQFCKVPTSVYLASGRLHEIARADDHPIRTLALPDEAKAAGADMKAGTPIPAQ